MKLLHVTRRWDEESSQPGSQQNTCELVPDAPRPGSLHLYQAFNESSVLVMLTEAVHLCTCHVQVSFITCKHYSDILCTRFATAEDVRIAILADSRWSTVPPTVLEEIWQRCVHIQVHPTSPLSNSTSPHANLRVVCKDWYDTTGMFQYLPSRSTSSTCIPM